MKHQIWGLILFLLGILFGGFGVGFLASLKIKGMRDVIMFKDSTIHRLREFIREKV